MPLDRPATPQHGFGSDRLEQMIQGADDAAVSARKILGFEHAVPAGEELVGQLQLLGQSFERNGHWHIRMGQMKYTFT